MSQGDSAFDVIVIGGGIAGMVAANRVAQLGKRVAVLEKSAEEKYICNSRITYGTFHINFTSPLTDEDELTRKIEVCTEGYARKDLARAVAKEGRRLMQWLISEGIDLSDLGQYHTHVLSPVARTGSGLKWENYAGDIALQRFEASLKKRGGQLLRGTRATALKPVKDGVEVEATQAGATKTFKAKAVVIADGGFTANTELVREHVSRTPERLLQRHGNAANGDGLRMAQAVGAARSTEMGSFYGHLHSRDAMTAGTRMWPRPQADDVAAASIVIDANGRRVADEGFGGIYLSNAIARLPDPLSTTIIFDQAVWDGPGRNHVQPPNPLVPEAGGTLHKANTLAELAGLIGLAPQKLEAVVAEYNKAVETGTLDKLDPPRRPSGAKAWPIRTAPFYAMPICSAITNTMGGIVVDELARVLDTKGAPIPGLFAAGSTVGGLDGGPHSGYVGGLIKAVIGLIAAETICAAEALTPAS
jgi:fumarate reductase flavoprotein subunit